MLASHQANSIPNCKIDLEFVDTTDQSLHIAVNAAQIEDAILNLIVNAIESIEKSGSVNVRLSRRRNGSQHDEAVITVTDTGCGIAGENRQRIFEPFFTTKPDGTGIGLAVVKQTASAFNGRISFQSRVGCGSIFELSLPLFPDQHAG